MLSMRDPCLSPFHDDLSRLLRRGLRSLRLVDPAPAPTCSHMFHQAPRLLYGLDGRHHLMLPGHGRIHLHRAEALWLRPGSWHAVLGGEACRYGSLTFHTDRIRYFHREHDGKRGVSGPHGDAFRVCSSDTVLQELLALADRWQQADRIALHWCQTLIAACLQLYERDDAEASAAGRWQRVVAIFTDHLPAGLGREPLAAAAGIHPGHLTALCRQHSGRSFQDWQAQRRLDHARLLLQQQPQLRVHQVARLCGWNDLRYFRRRFRTRFGCSPARMRGN